MSQAEALSLTEHIAKACRELGIEAAKVSVDGVSVELRMGPPPPAPEQHMSDDERAEKSKRDEHEARRRKFEKQFGRKVSDDELAGLP